MKGCFPICHYDVFHCFIYEMMIIRRVPDFVRNFDLETLPSIPDPTLLSTCQYMPRGFSITCLKLSHPADGIVKHRRSLSTGLGVPSRDDKDKRITSGNILYPLIEPVHMTS